MEKLHPQPVPLETTESPTHGFVNVRTPEAKLHSLDGGEIDVNGVRLHAWSSGLGCQADRESPVGYRFASTLCPCVALSQLEMRLGRPISYARSLAINTTVFSGRAAFAIAAIACLLRFISGHSGCLTAFAVWTALFVAFAIAAAHRVAGVRGAVRERYDIPGSDVEDRQLACLRSASVIRQTARQLQCDRAKWTAPATLQAFEV